ncbi:hypothetical protein ABPG75_003938 [Micractinium tetrahymenae]
MSEAARGGGASSGSWRMPAEWERHNCTWLGWPQRPDELEQPASKAHAAVAAAVAEFEPVFICATDKQAAGVQEIRERTVMEAGAISVDGQGTLLTTEERLRNPERAPHLSRRQYERLFRRRPGVQARLRQDGGYKRSLAALRVLEQERDAHGRPLRVIKLPVPDPPLHYTAEEAEGATESHGSRGEEGNLIVASYINFHLVNEGVVVPLYGRKHSDKQAVRILQQSFPGRRVVGVQARSIALGGGSIHCITLPQPAGPGKAGAA